uniref:IgGFc-binding protein-like isoform X5 n=1 Tax=Oncorhynchus gorbuscha TaxID=8017 RepID=UPI001EAF454E|nr:IgGFc-binding protein-like isoform X5 [Oncorhynchus gorbuscha]
MLGGTYMGLLATAALLSLLQDGSYGSVEGDRSSVTMRDAAGTCTVHSNFHYSTFDWANFRFVVPCTYVLARLCSSSETPLSHFSVEVKNEQRGNSSVSPVLQVNVEVENLRVSLHKRQNHRVMVNGIWKNLPLSLNGGTINIRGNAASVVLETNFNLFVSYDDSCAVHITVPASYSGKVCGMCGNFNHLKDDDYHTADGSEASTAATFGQSWQSQKACQSTVVPNECPPMEEAEYASEPYCGSLVSRHGPFAECQSVLGAESYFRSCVAGMCGAGGGLEVLCEALQSYADMCLKAGGPVPAWRNSTMCPLECGANSHYNACAEGCPEACSAMDTQGACGSCEERCECNPGFKLSGGTCVSVEDCGCWMNGVHYEKGATFMDGECDRVCQCMGGGGLQCSASSCADDEVCKVKEGVKGCFPSSPAICRVYGDPHYITFDGKAYTFQGGCSYTLAKTCGGHTPIQFSVTGQNWNPGSESSAKLAAVVLETKGLHLKIDNYSVTVNHVWQSLPIAVNGSYGEVKLYKKKQYTVMETTFGLQMLLDDHHRLFLQLDERYKGEMCGLCGTYSNDQGDDFLTPNGTKPETNEVTFANSWRVKSPEDDRCVASPPAPQPCDSHLDNQGYQECSKLLRDTFKPCHPFVHPTSYIDSCMSDHCASGGDMHVTCYSLKSYVTACQVASVTLPPWFNDTACDSLPGPPTKPPVTTPDNTFCPLDCNFDNSECGWEQIVQDSFDWRRQRGPTPSDLTGPTQDHTTGGGSYMYIEGNGVYYGDSARMISPKCQKGATKYCLRFWYHMYGQAKAMILNVYQLDEHNKHRKLWSKANNQGSTWYPAKVDINIDGSFQIIMEGIRGSDPQSDVAFDDISIHYGSCSAGSSTGVVGGPSVPPTVKEGSFVPHPVCNFDCTFDEDLCSFTQLMTDSFDWTRHSGSTPTVMTGPSADHTKGEDGYYLYIEASNVSNGDTARLLSSECSDSGLQCLQFWYHMSGSAETMGLHVYILQDRSADRVWLKKNNQGDCWQLAQVDLRTTGPFQIIFEGRRGTTDQSDVAIDDVSLHHGHCEDLIKPTTPTENPVPADKSTIAPTPAPITMRPVTLRPTTAAPAPTNSTMPSKPSTTARPQPPTTMRPETPAPPTTEIPSPPRPTTERPQPPRPTTERPQPPRPTTERPQPPRPTTERPQPPRPTTERPQPPRPTTERPQPPRPTTERPQPPRPTTERPQPPRPTTERPQPPRPTTARPQPPTTARPTPLCPNNSHFAPCISNCQPTCVHLHGPPDCHSDEHCIQGCVCDDGFVLRQRVCVPTQQCGCVDSNGNSHHFKESWYTEHCHQKCECVEDDGVGEIDCNNEYECDGDAICLQNEAGLYFCKSTGFSECSINGDSEYKTFNNEKHDFEGTNSHVLVQTTDLSKNQPDIYIKTINEIINQDGDDSHGDSSQGDSSQGDSSQGDSSNVDSSDEDDKHKDSMRRENSEDKHDRSDEDSDEDKSENNNRLRLRGLKIRVYNHIVEFRKNRKLVLDGRSTHAPVSPARGLRILESSSRIYLKTDFGLSVEFDGHSRAVIILPHTYKRRLGGLCGNVDGKKKNYMMKLNGKQAKIVK